MEWEIGAECLACVLIVLVLCFSREKFYTQMPQTRLYYACLGFALFSTLLNIATVVLMGVPGLLPRWLCYTLNMLYFTFFPLLEAALTYYMAYLIHGRGPCFTRVAICLGVMLAAALAVVFTNPFTGWLFYLDAAGTYVRGPYNRLLYALLVACCLLLVICYIKQFRTASRAIHRMMATLPLLAMVLGTVQYLFPPVMMTGFIPACILLVLFFNFQSQRINTDFLTGLSSRSALWYAAGTCLRSGQSFYCVAVCLRHFGDVNKQFGHTGGDAVLRQVSAYLEALGRRAVACRFSGVEFVLLFPGMDAAGYAVLEKELSERFAAPWQAGSVCCRLDAGVAGIACPRFGDTAERLTAHLEYAIQQLKLPGAPEALSFDTEMEQRFSRRVALRDVVVRTLSGQAAGVAYQPIYALDADTPCMAEALLRLCGADGKPVPTADVVSVAEEMDLIVALDWMMLEQVCAFFGAHRELDGCAVSVNFSARQFLAPDAERRVLDTLERHGLAPTRLKLELTERVLAGDIRRVRAVMEALAARGVEFYLDDFGTGYSNLSSVVSLPLQYVKVDRSLLEAATNGGGGALLLRAVVETFRAMGRGILLEGVETPEQYELVRRQLPDIVYDPVARTLKQERPDKERCGCVVVCTAGTADIPVAEEAAQTAEFFGTHVERLYDVGVSGIHRLLDKVDLLQQANCVVTAAGMEGALASVIGGLVRNPVIAVPTSVGYGASFHGLSALLTMINSCANCVSVVNIDNGYGAGIIATQINRLACK